MASQHPRPAETAPSLSPDLDALKRMGKELLDAWPTATEEERDAGWKCFCLGYLGADLPTASDEVQAVALYNIIARTALALPEPPRLTKWQRMVATAR